jgi:hypothetical protein
MYRPDEKGTPLTTARHPPQIPRLASGITAALVLVLVLALAAPALAAEAPSFQKPPTTQIVHSTRAIVRVELLNGELATEWKAEYAESESGPWTVVDSGETTASSGANFVSLGTQDPGETPLAPTQQRHLKPGTAYFARFIANNNDGEATDTVPFMTLPAGKPEVPRTGPAEGEQVLFFKSDLDSATTAAFIGKVETNGLQTEYAFEYAESAGGPWKPFTSGATGTVTVAEDFAKPEATLSGLAPETTYFVRLKMTNEKGEVLQTKFKAGPAEEVSSFTTGTAKPFAGLPIVRNVTGNSAHLVAEVSPHGSQTHWRLESAPSTSGPWTQVPGGAGVVSQAQAEARAYGDVFQLDAALTGLSPSTEYFVRLVAENECAVGCGSATSTAARFETSGPPSADTFAVHAIHGESLRLLAGVNPNSQLTSAEQTVTVEGATGGSFTLTFRGETTAPLAFDADPESVREAIEALPGVAAENGHVEVTGLDGGPYTVYFGGENDPVGERSMPQFEADASGLAPVGSASVKVVTTQAGGVGYDTHYRFEYVSQKQFEAAGGEPFAAPASTPEVDLGSGDQEEVAGEDVPGLLAGETYHYRLVATNTSPGDPVVEGAEQSLTVPVSGVGGETGPCPNEPFRTGLSAALPDCRAYEQLTPVDKEGAQELFHYRFQIPAAVVVGEDGEHAALEGQAVSYGSEPSSGQSPYFFSRGEAGWLMRAGAPQPQTGVDKITPELYSAVLSQVAFESQYDTSELGASPEVEYKVGPAGGPYTTVSSLPRAKVLREEGWAAADGDFSKLVLQSSDRTLLGEPTPTKSGFDLYEYSGGELRQLNVDSEGNTIGSCGARMVLGEEADNHRLSSEHSLSADGSRVFFEAVPGRNCAEPAHLYMRVAGSETLDVGAYKFRAANAQGTRLLLKDATDRPLGYDTETRTIEPSPAGEPASAHELGLLGIPLKTEPDAGSAFAHPRYTYFGEGHVAGLPGGGLWKGQPKPEGAPLPVGEARQVYRYDRAERVVQCISCASSSDQEPGEPAYLNGIQGIPDVNGGFPGYTAVSGNGDFAFFTTIAALVPQDNDLEIPAEGPNDPAGGAGLEFVNVGGRASPSTDVYEWRRDGVDGCARLQGCLALITDGHGGYLNLLLGSAHEGRDVFIYSRSKLSPQDNDTSGDVYDVRVDGGFAGPPPRAVECEGDACSTPPSAPNDATPSSFTFTGLGNVLAPVLPGAPAVVKPKPKPGKVCKAKAKGKRKCKAKRRRKGKRAKRSLHDKRRRA